MPTYSYACTACEHRFDTVQKFTDPSLTDCPECSGRLRKLFSSVGIVFKGSGFYRTDSRSTNSDKPSSNGKSEVNPQDKSSSKSSEAKPSSDSKTASASTSSGASATS
ncbi:MAG TPA: FmdB family zinc ribbon protein [Pseudonocardiaceae bacterium]|nr:FmdB family zinc ribbon protein [Pseudonocardiaceae bacterium]